MARLSDSACELRFVCFFLLGGSACHLWDFPDDPLWSGQSADSVMLLLLGEILHLGVYSLAPLIIGSHSESSSVAGRERDDVLDPEQKLCLLLRRLQMHQRLASL